MIIHINNDEGFALPDFLEELSTWVLTQEAANKEAEVSLTFVQDEEMQGLNSEYRGINTVTDVLSFCCDEILLGDIVIAPHQTDNIELMVVHGLLHLLGYDHLEDAEAEAMEARQDELLAKWSARV